MGGRIGGNGIAGLRAELKRRSTEPWRNATFFFGFLLNIAFSGWAIWLELLAIHLQLPAHDAASLQGALVTFFPAVIGVTFVQVLLEQHEDRRILAASTTWLVATLASAGYLSFVPAEAVWGRMLLLGSLCAASMWFWVAANADAAIFQDDPAAAIGGDPNADLSGGLGDLEA